MSPRTSDEDYMQHQQVNKSTVNDMQYKMAQVRAMYTWNNKSVVLPSTTAQHMVAHIQFLCLCN